jgi:teichuronic acid biosynthesis glycosyltransferase TuaC
VTRDLVSLERRVPDADVLVVTNMWPRFPEDAFGIFVRRQVDSLIDAGLRCDVMVINGHRSPLAYGAAAVRMARLAVGTSARYRLVHAHGGETAVPARMYVRSPLLVSYCGSDLLGVWDDDQPVAQSWRMRRAVVRESSRLAQATITKTAELERCLPRTSRRRNTVVPNGVDRHLFRPIPREEARARVGWDAHERIVLFAADPSVGTKRVELAMATCEEARSRGCPVRLHVAGHTPPDQMPLLMSAADCLLVTSIAEGSPNVVKEALACDLPIVSTPVGDVRALLAGVAPSAVAEAHPEALASALIECILDPVRSNGRGQSRWLDEREIANRILDIYRGLVPGVV